MYEAIERALRFTAAELWHRCIFTNLVTGSIGDTSQATAKDDQFRAGLPRLRTLLQRYVPYRVWIMGVNGCQEPLFSGFEGAVLIPGC